MWPMGLLFLKSSPVKQYSYENDLSGVFDALHQSFLVLYCSCSFFSFSSLSSSAFYTLLRHSQEVGIFFWWGWGGGSLLPCSLKIMPKSPQLPENLFPYSLKLSQIILLMLPKSLKIIQLFSSSPKLFR